MPSKQKASDPVTHLIGGAVSGLCACVFVQPLDLIKTRLQQQQQAHLAFIKQGGQAGLTIAPLERYQPFLFFFVLYTHTCVSAC